MPLRRDRGMEQFLNDLHTTPFFGAWTSSIEQLYWPPKLAHINLSTTKFPVPS